MSLALDVIYKAKLTRVVDRFLSYTYRDIQTKGVSGWGIRNGT